MHLYNLLERSQADEFGVLDLVTRLVAADNKTRLDERTSSRLGKSYMPIPAFGVKRSYATCLSSSSAQWTTSATNNAPISHAYQKSGSVGIVTALAAVDQNVPKDCMPAGLSLPAFDGIIIKLLLDSHLGINYSPILWLRPTIFLRNVGTFMCASNVNLWDVIT